LAELVGESPDIRCLRRQLEQILTRGAAPGCAVRRRQLRGPSRDPPRGRALRLRARGLHGCPTRIWRSRSRRAHEDRCDPGGRGGTSEGVHAAPTGDGAVGRRDSGVAL